jgi:hypothetical protein
LKSEDNGVSSGEEGTAEPKVGILTPQMSGSFHDSIGSSVPCSPNSNATEGLLEPKLLEMVKEIDSDPKPDEEQSFAMEPKSKGTADFLEVTPPQRKNSDTCTTYLSTNSASSTANSDKLGFLATDYLLRDVLTIVKECLADLNATRSVFQGRGGVQIELPVGADDIEVELTKRLQWSISPEELGARATRLGQYVSEALWRLRLVTDIPQQFGQVKASQSQDLSTDEEDLEAEIGTVLF